METKQLALSIAKWINSHPLFKSGGLCEILKYNRHNFYKILAHQKPNFSEELLCKMLPILKDYGYREPADAGIFIDGKPLSELPVEQIGDTWGKMQSLIGTNGLGRSKDAVVAWEDSLDGSMSLLKEDGRIVKGNLVWVNRPKPGSFGPEDTKLPAIEYINPLSEKISALMAGVDSYELTEQEFVEKFGRDLLPKPQKPKADIKSKKQGKTAPKKKPAKRPFKSVSAGKDGKLKITSSAKGSEVTVEIKKENHTGGPIDRAAAKTNISPKKEEIIVTTTPDPIPKSVQRTSDFLKERQKKKNNQ